MRPAGHDEVHVDVGAGIFFVAEIEQNVSVDDAHADGGDEIISGPGQSSGIHHFLQRDAKRHEGAGDGRGARAAVGLNDVAVDPDSALAEAREIGDRAQSTADEPLDFVGASALPAFGDFARSAGQRGSAAACCIRWRSILCRCCA